MAMVFYILKFLLAFSTQGLLAIDACVGSQLLNTSCVSNPYATGEVNDADQCCDMCGRNQRCVQWEFTQYPATGGGGLCLLAVDLEASRKHADLSVCGIKNATAIVV